MMPLGSSHLERPTRPRTMEDFLRRPLPPSQLPLLPWQVPGHFGSSLSGLAPCGMLAPLQRPRFDVPPRSKDLAAVKRVPEPTSEHVQMQAAKVCKLGRAEPIDAKKDRFVRLWMKLVLTQFPESALGQELQNTDDKVRSMQHTLFQRTGNTLSQRWSAVNSLARWIKKNLKVEDEFRFTEDRVYRFATSWHRHGTTVDSAISGINFVGGIVKGKIGQQLLDVAASDRVKGAASEGLAALPPRKQAATLEPREIQVLEALVCDLTKGFHSRQLAWVMLLLISLRARFGDLVGVIAVWIENELIVLQPSKTKTSKKDRSRLFLEMLGPVFLFSGQPWFETHMYARTNEGIPYPEWETVPVFNGRYYTNLPARGDDYNRAIQQLCAELGFVKAPQITGHTGKASMITFAGTRGMTSVAKSILSYHVIPGESKATRAYDRGRLLEPVKALQSEVDDFANNNGGTRIAEVSDDDGESSAVDTSDSGSSSEEEDVVNTDKAADNRLIYNEKSRAIHQGRYACVGRTACGVLMRAHYRSITTQEVQTLPNGKFSYCKRGCFSKGEEPLTEADGSSSDTDSTESRTDQVLTKGSAEEADKGESEEEKQCSGGAGSIEPEEYSVSSDLLEP